ncbi:short-chain dehydrogenase [Paenibacillus sp. P3E]|uniref:SDR family NAD(P)-dependent oxidoreductase n=1 Tax=unclassified Paenibacillus TaxID=185978 RepID=UPI00093A5AC4|nr:MULTISPECIES: SDR family NAD(P)-dependent oxidoreductase [unclassified Paenibacillus]OKP87922.1 short-chain dehydrogenase [Paenibacillus sp. P3E]OKP93882.1 short-chain dehydrogenase [Paenibacillus sp. P32E]
MTKTALVTGANKGIGFEIAKQLLEAGYRVLVGARDQERGETAVTALQAFGDAHLVLLDVADPQSIDIAVTIIKQNFPELTLLVNNAGIPGDMHKLGWEFAVEELQVTHQVNFIGPFALSKGLLPLLIANRGTIQNISIPIEPLPYFNAFAYQTSKAPLNVMTKSWGMSFEKENIPVEIFSVMPGAVSTDLNGNMTGDFVKTTAQAAEFILSFVLDDKNHNGEVINYDGTLAVY